VAVEHATVNEAMEQFYRDIQSKQMDALWREQSGREPIGPSNVRAPYQAWRWSGSDIYPILQRAGELVEPSDEEQRRAITLHNPTNRPMTTATHTVSAAVQMVLPGETAPAHRHTMAAIRFVMKGDGAITFIDGEGCSMHPGDLILTPGWTFHGHINRTDGPMIWMDALDVPLIGVLKVGLYEEYPDQLHPATKPIDDSLHRYAGSFLRPVADRSRSPISPLLSFPWAQSERALHSMAKLGEVTPFDDVAFQYTNPSTGGHVLPTIGCWIQMLRPGVHTKAHRHSTVSVYQVFKGQGSTIVDGVQIDWEAGDFIAIPPYAWHEHVNRLPDEEAVLFSVNDNPVHEALNLYREDPQEGTGGYQEVTATFEEWQAKSAPANGGR
jgi:gentisate 1,2-dioxygenase